MPSSNSSDVFVLDNRGYSLKAGFSSDACCKVIPNSKPGAGIGPCLNMCNGCLVLWCKVDESMSFTLALQGFVHDINKFLSFPGSNPRHQCQLGN